MTSPAPPSSGRTADTSHPPHHGGLLGALQVLLELLVVFLFVTTFLFQIVGIPSLSMSPTLRVGDVLVVDKQSFTARGPAGPPNPLARLLPPATVRRGDIAVFRFPVDPTHTLVKRVVALPGDRLFLHQGALFINGTPIAEPYATHSAASFDPFRDDFPTFRATDPALDPLWWATLRRTVRHGELTVPPGHVFVLGDNRDNSEDSRYWGFVPLDHMIGRPLVVFFASAPPSKPSGSPTSIARLRQMLLAFRVVR